MPLSHNESGSASKSNSSPPQTLVVATATPNTDRQTPPEAAEQVAMLQQQAEYLLDELSMGSADFSAHNPLDSTPRAHPQEAKGNDQIHTQTWPPAKDTRPTPLLLDAEINSLLTADAKDSLQSTKARHGGLAASIWPEDQLPTIRSAAELAQDPPSTIWLRDSQVLDPQNTLRPTDINWWPPPKPLAETVPSISQDEMDAMEEEILDLYDAINRVLQTRREITGYTLSLLREASNIIATDPQRVGRAEYNIQQVRQILDRTRASQRKSRNYALRIVLSLIVWMTFLFTLGAALLFYPQEMARLIERAAAALGWNTAHIFPALWAALLGGLGGSIGTISFAIGYMRTNQEVDRQYILRSMIQPTMGVVLSLFFYLLLTIFFSGFGLSINASHLSAYLPAALAFPIGFWQEGVYALIFRFTRLFTYRRRRW